jgi:hypothetical protein
VVEQLAQFLHGIADVGTQHVLAVELVVHLAHGAFQEGHAAGVGPGAVPGVRTVFRIVEQCLEERRLHAFEVALGLADDVARHEFGGVLEHVDETMQLAQDVVGQVAAGFRFAMHVDGHVGILAAHFLDEGAQAQHGGVEIRTQGELLVVDRQDERAGAALLLGELAQVAVAGDPEHFKTLGLDGLRQRTDAQPRSVLGTVILVDDDDGKTKLHAQPPCNLPGQKRKTGAKCKE